MAKETHKGTYQIFNQDNLPSVEHFIDSKALPCMQSHRELVSGADRMCLSGGEGEGEERIQDADGGMGF